MEINKQTVEDVESSQVIQTGDNSTVTIVNGMQPGEVIKICENLIQKEIANYTLKAEQTAKERYQELSCKLEERLKSLTEIQLEKIQEPAIQIAANETYTEYIRSGEESLGDELIDLLIDRMSVNEHTSKQIIIDEARRILPKLTKNLVDLLAIMTFVRLVLPRPRLRFAEMLKKIGDLGKNSYDIKTIDIALLNQTIGANETIWEDNQSVEEILSKIYDAFFRKGVPNDQYMALLSSRPEYNKQNQELFWNTPSKALLNHVGRLGNDWYYKYNTNEGFQTYKKDMKNPDMANLLTGFESLATKMNVSEVKEFLLSINENWKKISYLYSREDVRSLSIRPVGYYIGLRHLCRQTGEDIQFSVFYPDYK